MDGAWRQLVRPRQSTPRTRLQRGPVAFFKVATIVKRLPKTRSGKILRGTIKRIADGVEYRIPPTIDDPAILDEITADLTALGYGHRAATSRPGRQREQSEWLDTHPDSGDSDSLIGDTVFNAASSAV